MNTLTPTGLRVFDLIVYLTGFLDGEFDDWPAKIQDGVLQALQAKADEVELPLVIVNIRCDVDHDKPADDPHKFLIHAVASEVVMADERTIDNRRLH